MQGFECGEADYAFHVACWITDWIWEKPLDRQDRTTLIALDEDNPGVVVAYGTWRYVDEIGSTPQPKHIEIEWFGVHSDYQGKRDDQGRSVAGLVYATVEESALAHPRSQDDMPFTLACDVENQDGQGFWESRGYRLIPEPDLKVEGGGRYYRMVR